MRNVKAIALVLCCLMAPVAHAQDTQQVRFYSAQEMAAHQALIARLEDYLTSLTTIQSDFSQVAPDGSLASGKFFLKRPGRMRWQYNPPTPILMVADGSVLNYYDYELQQVNYIPLDSTLIGFLAQSKIHFDKEVGVTSLEEESGVIRVTLAQKKKPEDGQIMLEFTDKPLLLRNMVITDAQHQVTSVALTNAQFGIPLDKELFIFRDPRGNRHK